MLYQLIKKVERMENRILVNRNGLITQTSLLIKHANPVAWSLYVNMVDGSLTVQHNSWDSTGWLKVRNSFGLDCYGYTNSFPGDIGFDYLELAEYLVDEEALYESKLIVIE